MSRIQPTRILVVGAGGREHALAWKLGGEPGVNEVLVAPGGAAMAQEPHVRCLPGVDALDGPDLVGIARAHASELVVIGPEAPLAAGVADELRAAGFAVFGPSAAAARIESSKSFCREVAEAAEVPMAEGRAFRDSGDPYTVRFAAALVDARGGVVVKADGLAGGKGVTVCSSAAEAVDALAAVRGPVVVEERLDGLEASVIALCDGREAVGLPASRDHKRLLDGDEGPNTGGMGAYSPLPDLPGDEVEAVVERFHRPILAELARRGAAFRGALYAGLMLTADGPRLLECNARLGDPEAQVILPRVAVPLAPWLLAAARGELAGGTTSVPAFPGATVGIVLAGGRYPEAPDRGTPIDGLAEAARSGLVFHAGTSRDADGGWRTDGGRIVTVVGRGANLDDARAAAEGAASLVTWPGMQRRRDIAAATVGAAS